MHTPTEHNKNQQKASQTQLDAINQVFALFKLNFHNQFYKAFSKTEELNAVKRLWLDALKHFSAETMLRAAKSIIENNEFLPTLRTMIRFCEEHSHEPLPDPHAAYTEACRAPSPKAEQQWSHLAVYYAGKATDWYFLQSNTEQTAFPVFKQEYEKICTRIRNGLQLKPPQVKALPQESSTPLDKTSNQEKLSALKNSLNL